MQCRRGLIGEMTNRHWLVLVLLVAAGGSQRVAAQDRTREDLEPRIIGAAGTTAVGFSGYVDKFFSPDTGLPTNYTIQVDVNHFLTNKWVVRGGLAGSGSYGGDDSDELSTGPGAAAVHALGGASFYFTPRSIWSMYAGVGVAVQITQRSGSGMSSLIGSLGLQGAVSSRASLFIEGGFGRGLNKDDDDNRLSRFVGSIGIRLKL